MERKGVETCAGCKWNVRRLVKCCRATTESYCKIGNDYSHKKGYCKERTPRFGMRTEVKKEMEVELL